MSSTEDHMRAIAEDLLLSKEIGISEKINILYSHDSVREPFFKDLNHVTEFFLECAKELDDEGYLQYKIFFKRFLSHAKRDLISGEFLEKEDGVWQSVLLKTDSLKSIAQGNDLKAHQVPMHLNRYINSQAKQLLIKIPEWDKKDRVEELRLFIKLKNQEFSIFEDAFKEWGANIFRRLYHENAQNRCIILKGNQGIGKDHMVKSLLSGFGPYYAKFSSNRDEREAWSQVTGRLVLHIEEFDQTGQLSTAFLKDLITRDWVTYRAPYDRAAHTRKCVGSFISSVNIDTILRDETGNRRFAVFEIESIDWKYPKDWSEQILAQFHELYKDNYYAKPETWKAVSDSNSQYEVVDMGPEYLKKWDVDVALLATTRAKVEFSFDEISHIVNDLCRMSGWRPKTICSLLKSSGRSRHTKKGTIYWSGEKR